MPEPLMRLLLRLAQGVHRFAMYPAGHPSLAPAGESLMEVLAEVLAERSVLDVGIARWELNCGGHATDPDHTVLGEFAHRLHRMQLAALSFRPGVDLIELADFLRTLGRDADPGEVPLGLRTRDELPSWPHIRLHPLDVDRLGLHDSSEGWPGDRSTDLWKGLAGLALGDEAVDLSDPAALAQELERRTDEEIQAVSDQLSELASELEGAAGEDAAEVRARLNSLLKEIGPEQLQRLLAMGGDPARQRQLLRAVNRELPVGTVLKVLEAAAHSSTQTISHSMTRMLSKLSAHAPGLDGGSDWTPAGVGMTDLVDRLLDSWELEDPNPEGYTAILDSMSRATPIFLERTKAEEGEDRHLAGALRIVQTALEVGAFGGTVQRAVLDLVDGGQTTGLIDLVAEPDPESEEAAEAVLDYLAQPHQLRRVLSVGETEERTIRALADRMGPLAIEPFLDTLVDSDSRTVRRRVFDVLVGMGTGVGEAAVTRLEDERWFVQRNMLALLQNLEELPANLDPLWFAAHGDHRVRREAFPLALRDPASRDRALSLALSDRDEQLVHQALVALRDDLPPGLIPTVVNRGLSEQRSDEIRALAVGVLAQSDSILVRDSLVALAAPRRSLFGRPRIGERSAALLAALEALGTTFADDASARAVVRRARRSKDPEIRRAAEEVAS